MDSRGWWDYGSNLVKPGAISTVHLRGVNYSRNAVLQYNLYLSWRHFKISTSIISAKYLITVLLLVSFIAQHRTFNRKYSSMRYTQESRTPTSSLIPNVLKFNNQSRKFWDFWPHSGLLIIVLFNHGVDIFFAFCCWEQWTSVFTVFSLNNIRCVV